MCCFFQGTDKKINHYAISSNERVLAYSPPLKAPNTLEIQLLTKLLHTSYSIYSLKIWFLNIFFVLFIWRKKANKKMLSTQKKSTFLLEQKKNVWTFWNLSTSTQNVTPFVGNVIKPNCFVTCLLYTFSEIHFELKSNSKRMALKHIMSFYSIRSWN